MQPEILPLATRVEGQLQHTLINHGCGLTFAKGLINYTCVPNTLGRDVLELGASTVNRRKQVLGFTPSQVVLDLADTFLL